eukprot:m.66948 g.66948  ORF g.66948 m.66948 type:complete len:507 (+) comp23747_c1_seq1:60-1580(+)
MLKATVLMLGVLATTLTVCESNSIGVDPLTHTFVDRATGSQLFFHGVNFVRKGAPYIADIGNNNEPSSAWSINDGDLEFLASKGMNTVRLGLMWTGAMPEGPSKFNTSYFNQVRAVVDLLWSHNIYTIIDVHQDVLTPRLCGEGAPMWLNTTTQVLGGSEFPLPLALKPAPNLPSGLPNCSSAWTPIGWSSFYLTDVCGRAFEAIYRDTAPMKWGTQFALLWGEIAKTFTGHPGVLAYELMNEPWVGDAIEHPEYLIEPFKADFAELAPFYARLHTVIRAVDNNTMLFYSGMEVGDRLTTPVGFKTGPGGDGYNDKQALVMHNYCIIGTDGNGPEPGLQRDFCNVSDGLTFRQRSKDRTRLNTALIMTEFGATGSVPTGLEEIRVVADGADALSPPASWTYWCWDQFHPNREDPRWIAVSRSYATEVAGTDVTITGGGGTDFKISFTTGGRVGAFPTKVFYAPGLQNASVSVEPQQVLSSPTQTGPHTLEFHSLKEGVDVTISITM